MGGRSWIRACSFPCSVNEFDVGDPSFDRGDRVPSKEPTIVDSESVITGVAVPDPGALEEPTLEYSVLKYVRQ
jgi:hypothetical protein